MRGAFSGMLQTLWNSLEVRVLVLLSLFLQIVLITTGNRRKYIRKKWVAVIIWLCYLSADVVATTALGVLSRSSDAKSSSSRASDAKTDEQHSYAIMSFWAPFLLMHLGGPDSITAYALADNELWSRHFLGLVGQVSVAAYVLLRSWISAPINYLWFAIFAGGLLKYGERTLVLFWASKNQFRKWMVSPPDPGPNYAKFMDEFVSKESEGFEVSIGKVIDIVSLSTPIDPPKLMDDPYVSRESQVFGPSSSTSLDTPLLDVAAQGVTEMDDQYVSRESQVFGPSSSTPLDTPLLDVAAQGVTEIENATFVKDVYPFFLTFKKLFADLILSFQDKETSLSYFKALTWEKAFGIVEIELGLIYDLFYTKAFLLYSPYGFYIRLLSWLCTIASLVVFVMIDKNAYPKTEVIITYILLVGAILIEIYAVIIFSFSDWLVIWSSEESTTLPGLPVWELFLFVLTVLEQMPERILEMLPRLPITSRRRAPMEVSCLPRSTFVGRTSPVSMHCYLLPANLRWSNGMGQYNVLDHCINREPNVICRYLKEYLFWNGKSVPKRLKVLIFDVLKNRLDEKQGSNKILLPEMDCFEKINDIAFDQSVLLWHMATDFCYHTDEEHKPEENWLYGFIINGDSPSQDILRFKREISVFLSNYMVHLLMTSPFMLPSGIGQIRFQDTRAEAIEFFDGHMNIGRSEACTMLLKVDTRLPPSKVKGDRSKSLLFDACRLAKSLQPLEADKRWEKITQAWLDILTFASAQCKWSDHAEKLSQGGELLTHVWLLMAHFGMTDQFQISQGYQRVKLDLK